MSIHNQICVYSYIYILYNVYLYMFIPPTHFYEKGLYFYRSPFCAMLIARTLKAQPIAASSYEIVGSALRGMGRSTVPALLTVIGSVVFRVFGCMCLCEMAHLFCAGDRISALLDADRVYGLGILSYAAEAFAWDGASVPAHVSRAIHPIRSCFPYPYRLSFKCKAILEDPLCIDPFRS